MALNFQGGRFILGSSFAGWTINIYEPGTTTAKTTYKDSQLTGGNENTATITLDAYGAAQIWYNGNAKWVLKNAAGSTIYTDDNVNLSTTSTSTGAANLIINPSFEDDVTGDGIPDSWDKTLYTDGAFLLDTTNYNNGAKSPKFTSVGTGGGYLTSTDYFSVTPGVAYSVLFWLKSDDAAVRNTVDVLWYQADETASATASTSVYDNSTTNPTSWTEKTAEVTAPSDAAFAKIRLTGCHSSDATTGSTWFDSVIMTDYVHKRAASGSTETYNPIGIISPYAGTAAPSGWLLCNGSAVSRTTYANLYAVIGTNFGIGDGSTSYNLPNLSGRVPLGLDNMSGTSANVVTSTNADILGGTDGAEDHTLTIAETPSHTHAVPGDTAGNDTNGYGMFNSVALGMTARATAGTYAYGTYIGTSTSSQWLESTGGGTAHNIMNPYLAVNYIIKH